MENPYTPEQFNAMKVQSSQLAVEAADYLQGARTRAGIGDFSIALIHVEAAERQIAQLKRTLETAKDMQESNRRVMIADGRIATVTRL